MRWRILAWLRVRWWWSLGLMKQGIERVVVVAMRMGCAEVAGVVENLWNLVFAVRLRGF
jgi:hypothetical protein